MTGGMFYAFLGTLFLAAAVFVLTELARDL